MTDASDRDRFAGDLSGVPLFSSLDGTLRRELARDAQWREYESGQVVVREGEAVPGLFYLQYGWVKVVKTSPSGREQVLRFLEPGETFNATGVFSDEANPATAVALERAGIWLIRRATLLDLLQKRPEFARYIVAQMAERIHHLVSLVTDLSLRPVTGRLARLLLEAAREDVLHRPRWYTQAELASRLGTVPDVIQRSLRSLESDGIIVVERQQIRILDRAALVDIAL